MEGVTRSHMPVPKVLARRKAEESYYSVNAVKSTYQKLKKT